MATLPSKAALSRTNQGGGVGNVGGRVAIADSTISGNLANEGGGVI